MERRQTSSERTERNLKARLVSDASPDPDVAADPLGRSSSAADVVRFAIARAADRILRHEPGMRSGTDPEHVHQARVATRRLRSELRTLGDAVDPQWVADTADDLKWLASTLGHVRDLDVRIPRLKAAVARLPAEDAVAGEAIVARVLNDHAMARAALADALDSDRYIRLLECLVMAVTTAPVGTAGVGSAKDLLRPRLRTEARRMTKKLAVKGRATDDELHRVRIEAKRMRYASELARPVLGKKMAAIASAAEELQTVLGDMHDGVVNAQHLRDDLDRADAHEAYATGLLVAHELAGVSDRGREWQRSRKRLQRAIHRSGLV